MPAKRELRGDVRNQKRSEASVIARLRAAHGGEWQYDNAGAELPRAWIDRTLGRIVTESRNAANKATYWFDDGSKAL